MSKSQRTSKSRNKRSIRHSSESALELLEFENDLFIRQWVNDQRFAHNNNFHKQKSNLQEICSHRQVCRCKKLTGIVMTNACCVQLVGCI